MLIFFWDSTVLEMLRASQNGLVFFLFLNSRTLQRLHIPAHEGEDHASDLCKDQVLNYTQLPMGDSSHMFQEGQITWS